MNNAAYSLTTYETITFKGTVNAACTHIAIEKDNGTTVSVPIADFFADFKGDTIKMTVVSKADNETSAASSLTYAAINAIT